MSLEILPEWNIKNPWCFINMYIKKLDGIARRDVKLRRLQRLHKF